MVGAHSDDPRYWNDAAPQAAREFYASSPQYTQIFDQLQQALRWFGAHFERARPVAPADAPASTPERSPHACNRVMLYARRASE